MRFSSTSTPGSGMLSLPEAMTMFFVSYSSPPTATLFGAAMRPSPLSQATLFLRNRNSTPFTLADTTSPLRASMRPRSSPTFPFTITPWSASLCRASS